MNSAQAFRRINLIVLLTLISCTTTKHRMTAEEEVNVRPVGMATVSAPDQSFLIDRFENSIVDGFAVSTPNATPATHITFSDARHHCESQGKKICTDRQWMDACLGINRYAFTYDSRQRKDKCNVDSSRPSTTGSYRQCITDGSIYDMLGNVMEWVQSDENPESGLLAGGSYRTGAETSCFTRRVTTLEAKSMEAGFRCCAKQ